MALLIFIGLILLASFIGNRYQGAQQEYKQAMQAGRRTQSGGSGSFERLQSIPYGTGCLNEARRQAPAINFGAEEPAIIALAEGCVALMQLQEEQRRLGR